MPKNPKFYTTSELSALLRMRPKTLQHLAIDLTSGEPPALIEFPVPTKYGRDYFWPVAEVNAHFDRMRQLKRVEKVEASGG